MDHQRAPYPILPGQIVASTERVPSPAGGGVDTGTSRGGSFDSSGMSTLGDRVVEFSINPITGESGVDRVLVSGLPSTQLWKSWIWSFSCAGRYWILAKQDFK